MITAMATELVLRKQYLQEKIQTIYFGGGTPSLLNRKELSLLTNTIYKNYDVSENAEVTIETNPDDINEDSLTLWTNLGFNRLSIGTQSFNDDVLKYLNRVHNSSQSIKSIELARKHFYNNINIDLIYSIPGENHLIWKKDLSIAIDIMPEHISAYNLTIEEKTVFGRWKKKGKLNEANEDFSTEQYKILTEGLGTAGYEHYEVSNFCLPGKYSKHNTSYWQRKQYLGIGPGAHSFNINDRQFNISSNPLYIKALKESRIPAETEVLSQEDKLNEYLLTGLRTKWGVDVFYLREEFDYEIEGKQNFVTNLITRSLAIMEKNKLILTEKGLLLADEIALELAV